MLLARKYISHASSSTGNAGTVPWQPIVIVLVTVLVVSTAIACYLRVRRRRRDEDDSPSDGRAVSLSAIQDHQSHRTDVNSDARELRGRN